MAPVLLVLLALPFVEIAVFIKVGGWIGVWPTILLTLLSSFVGLQLMRHQGLATLVRARAAVQRNEPPIGELLDGLSILLAGFLLIVPGFVTDVLGLLLFVPWIRRVVRSYLWRGLGAEERWRRGRVIETDYRIVREDEERDPKPPKIERDRER